MLANFGMVLFAYRALDDTNNLTEESAIALLGFLTLGFCVFAGLFIACVPKGMRNTFYWARNWKTHMREFWWAQQVRDMSYGFDLRGHEAVRAVSEGRGRLCSAMTPSLRFGRYP